MAKSKITVEVFLPTASKSRTFDFLAAVEKVVTEHKGSEPWFVISGPYHDEFRYAEQTGNINVEHSTADRGQARSDHQRSAAADFADGAPEASGGDRGETGDGGTEAGSGDGKPGRKPRSDAGKPRGPRGGGGSAEASGAAPARSERGSGGDGKQADRSRGNGAQSASQGGQRGERQGEGGQRQGDGGGRGTGGAQRGNEQAAPVGAANEDWDSAGDGGDNWDGAAEGPDPSDPDCEAWWAKTPDDRWPDHLMPEGDITRETISGLMSDHYRATGGKQKGPTFALLADVTGAQALSDIDPNDFDNLARALLKDTARYVHGVKKPVTTAAKA